MNRFAYTLLFILILGLPNTLHGQTNKLFVQNELDSINCYYAPLYSSDSINIKKLDNCFLINAYLFNGECSLCLHKMKIADDYFQKNTNEQLFSFFIVETSDTITFNYHRDKLGIESSILWDKNQRIRGKDVTASTNSLFLIKTNGNILFEGDVFSDEKLMGRYMELLGELYHQRFHPEN